MHETDNRASKVAGLSQMISTKTLHANLKPVQMGWNKGVFNLPLRLDFGAWYEFTAFHLYVGKARWMYHL